MGCKSALGHIVHSLCSDLDFKEAALLVLYCDMKRFVSVRLRIGNPVPETLCVGLILLCHIREYLPAESMFDFSVLLAVNDESDSENIEDSFERNLLLLHLLVYRQSRLGTYLQLILYSFIRELLLQRLDELGHELLPVAFGTFKLVGNGPVLLRLGISEVDVLHLALDVAQSLEGRVNMKL